MKPIWIGAVLLSCALPSHAQLTTDQKVADFQIMADQFVKRYVSLSWKQTLFGVDAFNIAPFLARASATTNDLDFYEVCIDYVAQFHDGGHVYFGVPSDFVAQTGILVDTYDGGKPLIYTINRALLPTARFPFQIGDEIVSIDGQTAAALMAGFAKYGVRPNPRTEEAYAAFYMTYRPQSVLPHAVDTPDSSQFVIRRQNGNLETYSIPWVKSGVPLLASGPVDSPRVRGNIAAKDEAAAEPLTPQTSVIDPTRAVTGIGALRPVFNLPANFKIRLGQAATDPFYSGTFQSNGFTIGFIRIPSFNPSVGFSPALTAFEREIAYFNANTDGLVVDDMRNPGGILFYGAEIARRLIPVPFHVIGFELRATTEWMLTYDSYVSYLQAIGAPSYAVTYQQALLQDVKTAYSQDGGHTGPEPLDVVLFSPAPPVPSLDTTPATDNTGKVIAYTKPILVLTDEFSYSTADYFPAIMQDNHGAVIYGMRTSGLGGTNTSYNVGAFSEARIGMLRGLMVRKNAVSVPGYPTTNYVENVGVQPDIVDDYKTRENLLNGGATFVNNFTAAMVKMLQAH